MTFVPVANTLKSQRGKAGGGIGPEETLVAETVRSHPRPGSNSNGNLVTAFHQTQDPIHGDEFSPALGVMSLGMGVAFSENQRGELLETEVAHQLTAGGGKPGQGYPAVREGASVRRLTPTECERLQGLDDGWTNPDGTAPDSRRYAGLGDAVTATVGHWLGARIRAADEAAG